MAEKKKREKKKRCGDKSVVVQIERERETDMFCQCFELCRQKIWDELDGESFFELRVKCLDQGSMGGWSGIDGEG